MVLIAVVDDDPKDAALLKECVESYCKTNHHAAVISEFRDGLALVEKDGKLAYIDHDGAVVWREE